jgi:hypothetical protein
LSKNQIEENSTQVNQEHAVKFHEIIAIIFQQDIIFFIAVQVVMTLCNYGCKYEYMNDRIYITVKISIYMRLLLYICSLLHVRVSVKK